MKIDFRQIKELLRDGNLANVSAETGIPYRTLQDWKLEKNRWLKEAENRLTELQKYINKESVKTKFIGVVNLGVDHDVQIAETDTLEELLEILADFEYVLQVLLDELTLVELDVDSYSEDAVECLIYVGNDEQMENDDFWNETDYSIEFIKIDNEFKLNELNVTGLEFNGEKIKEFEEYKVLFESFEEFVDDVAFYLEREYGIDEVPAYATIEEPALTLLKNGRIQDARERLEHEILKFNDTE